MYKLNHISIPRQRLKVISIFYSATAKQSTNASVVIPELSIKAKDEQRDDGKLPRVNALGIQMLSESLHAQIFGKSTERNDDERSNKILKSINRLKEHGLWGKESSLLPDVNFKLPKLEGNNIDQHFRVIAKQQTDKYFQLVNDLAISSLPPLPEEWNYQAGWTKYSPNGGYELVDFPDEQALVFDVEVCVSEGQLPTLAAAVSSNAWYSWCSLRLTESQFTWSQNGVTSDLIPLETKLGQAKPADGMWKERVIVGHNVSFDRARIKEQYYLKGSKTRFIDTMSLHIATSGITSFQRSLLLTEGTDSKRKDVQEAKSKLSGPPAKDWMHVSSLNNLGDVHQLHCGTKIEKELRNMFVTGTMVDIRTNFQRLMGYCASDVSATHGILQTLLPLFFERFPHPATFAGMLEMSVAYLPVNENWKHYLRNTQATFDDLEQEVKLALMHLANQACDLMHGERYKNDPWLWDVDWSTQDLKMKKVPEKKLKIKNELDNKENKKPKRKSGKSPVSEISVEAENPPVLEGFPGKYLVDAEEDTPPSENIEKILNSASQLYKRRPFLAGYPAWFRQLCSNDEQSEPHWSPGQPLISVQMQIAPKLLRLTWDGFPLHYDKTHGWGYLRPVNESEVNISNFNPTAQDQIDDSSSTIDHLWEQLEKGIGDPVELGELFAVATKKQYWTKKRKIEDSREVKLKAIDIGLPNYIFVRLPHKNGPANRVGNPLAKDFMNKIDDGTLRAHSGAQADLVLRLGKMTSYWRNAQKRISSQIVVQLKKPELPRAVTRNDDYIEGQLYGAILPLIVTAGTVTRRAVEPTWLTASNAYTDRVGSELKSMIQVPPGYNFVGADVDSQELWIAAIIGDQHFAREHGCTAFGWMTLQGKKSDGTDMHSRTANTVGISRDHAKVLNYGRIYGAGQPFAQQLLMQFNHRLTPEEAKAKAQSMFAATKGVKGCLLNNDGVELYQRLRNNEQEGDIVVTKGEALQLLMESYSPLKLQDIVSKWIWIGGTESDMFNKLEEIAHSEEPTTPVLGCRISRALEPAFVKNNFMTSRVNWVVQSSAVDYLHLLLVSMRWLCDTFNIDARFAISIHDEVRYLVKAEDRYRAALALQITNLLTRAMFAYKLGMTDLPQSVAFFSAVDIDTVLRKEVTMDCKTPSNPHGLHKGYGIPPGEALDIYTILDITKGSLKTNR